MSISNISTDTSAVWSIYQFNPAQPPEPPNFGQYLTKNDTGASIAGAAESSTSSAGTGPSKIGVDLNALLLDLQSTNGTGTSGAAASTSSTSPAGPASTPAPGSGDVTSDLQTFFNDLQNVQSNGQSAGAAHGAEHHHHHYNPAAGSQGSFDLQGSTAVASTGALLSAGNAQPASTTAPALQNGLLGSIANVLQNYGSFGVGSPTQSSVTLSA